jgi:hypothetical protein
MHGRVWGIVVQIVRMRDRGAPLWSVRYESHPAEGCARDADAALRGRPGSRNWRIKASVALGALRRLSHRTKAE